MRKLRFLTTLLVFMVGCNSTPIKEGDRKMIPEIRYSSTWADPIFPLTLSIDTSGMASLSVGTNLDNPDLGAVGVFGQKLDNEQLADLVAALRSRDFINIQNPKSALPGEAVRELCIKEEGQGELEKWISFHNPASSVFLKVEEKALVLVNLVRQHPISAMTMKVGFPLEQLDRGKPIEFSVTIINPGSESVQVPHPNTWLKRNVQLQMIGLRSNIPLEQLEDYHQRFEELSEVHLLKIQGTKVAKPLIAILPGERLVFTFRINLDWPPGQYDLRISFVSPLLNREGVMQLDCQLISKPHAIKIIGKSKPGDEPEQLDEGEDS